MFKGYLENTQAVRYTIESGTYQPVIVPVHVNVLKEIIIL
ncbi:hypothetical Protein YC6258_03967 [Gynuella sunshinyii YC6258]|uniref:Uncharacterized protein n=1 Tax=Gynuella sunshinyii YC6258 TaxID=1445510 RepID=A0A0C5VRG7_9GAMM|nr:hypothetical Protein YC6258_03967 [Gynuella sunshinyii YC6258]